MRETMTMVLVNDSTVRITRICEVCGGTKELELSVEVLRGNSVVLPDMSEEDKYLFLNGIHLACKEARLASD